MGNLLEEIIKDMSITYAEFLNIIPDNYSALINVFVFAILISAYSIFTWKFYRFLSKKDLIELNLRKYNKLSHRFLRKVFATLLYLVEYIIVLPFLIFFWFSVLALIILVLSEELVINQVLIVAASMVASIRMLAYYEEDLSKDLAKIFPFTILAIFILSPSFFSLDRILGNLISIPSLITHIYFFLILMVGLELILRLFDLFFGLFYSEKHL